MYHAESFPGIERIFLVRHGDYDKFEGVLNEAGRSQAVSFGSMLLDYVKVPEKTLLLYSPVLRATQTAHKISSFLRRNDKRIDMHDEKVLSLHDNTPLYEGIRTLRDASKGYKCLVLVTHLPVIRTIFDEFSMGFPQSKDFPLGGAYIFDYLESEVKIFDPNEKTFIPVKRSA